MFREVLRARPATTVVRRFGLPQLGCWWLRMQGRLLGWWGRSSGGDAGGRADRGPESQRHMAERDVVCTRQEEHVGKTRQEGRHSAHAVLARVPCSALTSGIGRTHRRLCEQPGLDEEWGSARAAWL
jgi:hypothetical protein